MLAYVYIAFAFLARLIPHGPFVTFCQSCGLWNLMPLGASLLYFGARQQRRRMWIPVLAFALSDVILNLFVWHIKLDATHLFVWCWYAIALLIGSTLRSRLTLVRLGLASLVLSLSFFIVSNFAVWLVDSLYPHTLAGLATCYVAALPFLKNTVLGDLLFSAAMFGLPMAAAAVNRSLAHRAAA